MMTEQEVRDRLALLPTESADAVAAFLQEHGVKGKRVESNSCPIANWVGDPSKKIGVCASGIGPNVADAPWDITPGKAVRDFVLRFDGENYPELIA